MAAPASTSISPIARDSAAEKGAGGLDRICTLELGGGTVYGRSAYKGDHTPPYRGTHTRVCVRLCRTRSHQCPRPDRYFQSSDTRLSTHAQRTDSRETHSAYDSFLCFRSLSCARPAHAPRTPRARLTRCIRREAELV
jgi:hypothetical protein